MVEKMPSATGEFLRQVAFFISYNGCLPGCRKLSFMSLSRRMNSSPGLNICFRLPAGRNFSLSLDENTSLIAFLDSPVSILRTLMAVSDRYDCKIAVS